VAKVTIDGKEYETDEMSEKAKQQLQNVAFCDRKLEELRNEAAVIQTARGAYARDLAEQLKNGSSDA
jgi:hypothetical protein